MTLQEQAEAEVRELIGLGRDEKLNQVAIAIQLSRIAKALENLGPDLDRASSKLHETLVSLFDR